MYQTPDASCTISAVTSMLSSGVCGTRGCPPFPGQPLKLLDIPSYAVSIELKDRYRSSYKEDIRKQRTCPSISLTKAGKGEAKKEKKKENQPLSKSHNPHEARSEKSK